MHKLSVFSQLLILLLLSCSECVSATQSAPEYYTAAVLEHARLGNISDPPREVVRRNLDMYERAADVAASKGADIIVFPEYGLFVPNDRQQVKTYVEHTPDPRLESSNPCEEKDEFAQRPILYTFSCMAKKHNMVVVANTGDIQSCVKENNSKCPDDGVYHFNTMVTFNRNGSLIARSYKMHLFYEVFMDLPVEPQNFTFETDFGSFATFICFDYVFKDIVEASRQVDNIILSTMWMDRMPLSNSVQFYQAFALGNNVTYLASNINIPGYGATGSGIFSGHFGPIIYTHNPDGLSKLVVSRVPRSKDERSPFFNPDASITVITENGTEEYDEEKDGKDVPEQCSYELLGLGTDIFKDYRCLDESFANYTLVKLTDLSGNVEACNNGMCCSLTYSASSMNENYYFGVQNGTYNLVNRYYWCVEDCVLVRCDDGEDEKCATFPTRSSTVFNSIEIKANFSTEYVYPSVVNSYLRLAPLNEWSHHLEQKGDSLRGHLHYESQVQEPVLVAGLSARCYERDPPYVR